MTCEVVDSILPVHLDQRWRRKSKSSSYCSAINCTNRQSRRPDLSFFRFPRKKERCQQWVQNTRRQDLVHRTPEQLSTHYCLCSLHFELNQFSNKQTKNRLNWNAVPTLFDFPNPPKVSHNIQTEHSYCSATDKVPRKEHSSVSTTPETPDLQFTPNVNDSRALKKERQRTFRLRKRIQQIKLSMGKNTTESKTISDLIRGAGEFLQEPALSFFASQLHNASGRRSARGRRWSYAYKLQRSTENMKRTRNPSNIKKQSMQDKVKQVIRKNIQTLEGPATASGHAAVPDPAPASVRVPPPAPSPAPSPASAPAPAAAAECDSNLAQETDASAVPAKKKKTVVAKPYNFTKEQQGDLVEWYQTHRELHDKGHRDFRSTDLSNAMLEDKAKEFPGCSYDQLCQWFKSQRTRFGRLGKSHSLSKPGSASQPLTDREQWIVEKWGFVRNHIVRVHRRKSGKKLTMGKSSCATSSEGETDPPEGPSGSGTADKQQHAKQKPACTTAPDCDVPVQQRQREMFTDIMQQAKTTAETINVLSQPRTPHERIVYAYSTLLREEMLQIPESQWHIFCLEGLILARAHRLLLPSPMRPIP